MRPVFGHQPQSPADGARRRADADVSAFEPHPAREQPVGAEEGAGQLGSSRSEQAVDAEHLALVKAERDVAQAFDGLEPLSLEDHPVGRVRLLADGVHHRPADHHADDVRAGRTVDIDRADHGAVPQHRDPVGQLEHLLEAVRDVDDREAARREARG